MLKFFKVMISLNEHSDRMKKSIMLQEPRQNFLHMQR